MRVNLKKKDLLDKIYKNIGFPKNVSENIVNDIFKIIIENLTNNDCLKISKFGTFKVRTKKARIGRNPKNKVEAMISSRKVVTFKPSKEFKKYINIRLNE